MMNMKWSPVLAIASAEKGGHEAAEGGAEKVLEKANEHVPLLSGTLEGTGTVSTAGSEAAISYDTVYAARLHEHPEYNFRGQGRGRWLQDAVDEHEGVLEAMAESMREAF